MGYWAMPYKNRGPMLWGRHYEGCGGAKPCEWLKDSKVNQLCIGFQSGFWIMRCRLKWCFAWLRIEVAAYVDDGRTPLEAFCSLESVA